MCQENKCSDYTSSYQWDCLKTPHFQILSGPEDEKIWINKMTNAEQRQLAGLCNLAVNSGKANVWYKGRCVQVCLESIKKSGVPITMKLDQNGIVEFFDVNNQLC